jgi:hypothetical protein
MQDRYHGQPHGMFAADECFGGRALNRGIELCAVVEQMFSLSIVFQIQGDTHFLDRLETIAFNAWPGTVTPDMWQHQYVQQANEINAAYNTTPHVWVTDGPDAAGFGVAPNFPCCTTNMQQSWPKYAGNIFMVDANNNLVVALLAPAMTVFQGRRVFVNTSYPFSSNLTIRVSPGSTFALRVRVPGWADATRATLNGNDVPARNGTLLTMDLATTEQVLLLELNPRIEMDDGWGMARTVLHPVNYSSEGMFCRCLSSWTLAFVEADGFVI